VLISLENASLELNHRRLLSGIRLEVKKGDVLCVVGANGSGKSTLLKLLAGQHWQTSGKRLYHFTIPPRASPIGAPITLVSPEMQERYQRLQHDRTALEVLATGFAQTDFLYTRLEPAQQQTLLGLAATLHLESLLEQAFFTLSKGQMRQVLLARAMLGQPQVLLLDEFFSGVDSTARLRLRQTVLHFLTQGGTLIHTTHRFEAPLAAHEQVLEMVGGAFAPQRAEKQETKTQIKQTTPPSPASTRGALRSSQGESHHAHHNTFSRNEASSLSGAGLRASAPRPTGAALRSRKSSQGELHPPLIQVQNANVYLGRLKDNATAPDGHQENEQKRILEDINFRLLEKQHWLVTGHNGAGKSTFAKLLRGDLSPAVGGTVQWFGLEHLPIWERHAQIALVSSDVQHIHRVDAPGFEVIASGYFGGVGWHHKLEPKQHRKVLELAAALKITHLLEQNALYTSQGELRKLLLARALVSSPKVILLDEAFDYLDAASRDLVWQVLLEQSATLVIIAHRQEDKPPFATQHLELQQGRIVNNHFGL
jgi:molybdate transport system ATP-binding protein